MQEELHSTEKKESWLTDNTSDPKNFFKFSIELQRVGAFPNHSIFAEIPIFVRNESSLNLEHRSTSQTRNFQRF